MKNKILPLCIAALMVSGCSASAPAQDVNEISGTDTEIVSDTETTSDTSVAPNTDEESQDSDDEAVVMAETGEKSEVKISETEDFSFYVTKHYTNGAEICIENNSDMTLHWGSEYSVEKLSEGEWHTLAPILDSYGWTMEQRGMGDGESVREETYCWDWLYGVLPEGDYRIIKSFSFSGDDGVPKRLNLAAEFSIEPTDGTNDIWYEDAAEAEDAASGQTVTKDYSPTETEKAEIRALLSDCKDFFYGYIECKEIKDHIDKNSSVRAYEISDNGMYKGHVGSEPCYEIADGDVVSMDDLMGKMTPLFTEKMIGDMNLGYYYVEKDGKMYLKDSAYSNGGVLGTDELYITSVGEADENTLVLYITAFGAGENWDVDHDLINEFTIQLKRTDSGFKVDVCDFAAEGYIAWIYSPEDDIFKNMK